MIADTDIANAARNYLQINAKLFLFDEPLSNLDAQLRDEMRLEIKKLHQDLKRTMIYVTHDQIEAMTLADRIVPFRDGKSPN